MLSQVKKIYDKMQDDISREIFVNRVLFSITDDFKYIRNIFDFMPITSKFLNAINDKEKLVIFGAGRYGEILVKAFPEFPWIAYVDNNKEKHGQSLMGLPIVSSAALNDKYADAYVVVSSRLYWREIAKEFKNNTYGNDYLLLGELVDSMIEKQYFDCPLFPNVRNEIFVDAGVLDGNSTLNFIKWANENYENAYLFEPNISMAQIIEENLGKHRYSLIKKGLWDSDANLSFVSNLKNLGGGYVCDDNINNHDVVPVTTLDNVLQDVRVTFIKMDIEGAELNALRGGEGIIRKFQPKLAISIYHKKEDIIEIPKFILNCNPNYKFYIRHYVYTENETVLYAVP